MEKQERLAHRMLNFKPNVDAKVHQKVSLTPLQAACFYGCSRPLLKELLERSISRAAVDEFGSGLLRLACKGNASTVHGVILELLEANSDPNGRRSFFRTTDGMTALMEAARQGNLSVVETLLSHKADPRATDRIGWSAVHFACDRGHTDILRALQRHQIDWNARIRLHIAKEIFINATILHLAVIDADSGSLEFLLTQSVVADMNATTSNGATALSIAAWKGHSQSVALLLSNNADDMIPEKLKGFYPLHYAAQQGYLDVVSTFIDYSVNVRVKDDRGMTPELIARAWGHFNVALLLEEYSRDRGAYLVLIVWDPRNDF